MTLSIVALAGTITFPALGHLAYNFSIKKKKRTLTALAILLFALTSVCTYLALQSLTLGLVYSSTALTQAIIMYFGTRFLGEKITRQHVFAVALIMAGVMLFGLGSFAA